MRRLWPLFSILMLSGCLKFHTRSDYNIGVDYSAYKTYHLQRDPHLHRSDPETDTNILLADRINVTVREILGSKGITPSPKEAAAMWVYWSISIQRSPGPSDGPHAPPAPEADSRSQASAGRVLIIFEMIDAATEKSFWRGTAESELYPDLSSRTQAERIRDAVRNTLEPFPPKD